MIAMVAGIMPGAHADDNNPIVSGKIIETAANGGPGGDAIALDVQAIVDNSGTERLGNNLGTAASVSLLVVEPQ
jgi:hypothetical protein